MRNKSYHRNNRETDRAYNLFIQYLNMGTGRTLEGLAEQSGTKIDSIKRYNAAHDWGKRASDYDEELLGAIIESRSTIIADNQVQVMDDGLNDYEMLLGEWRKTMRDPETRMTPTNLNRLIRARKDIDELGRRAVQLPMSYSSHEIAQVEEKQKVVLGWAKQRHEFLPSQSPERQEPEATD